ALMEATEVLAEAQVTWLVRSCVELSEYVPVAVNGFVVPMLMVGLGGVTAIDSRTASLTVNDAWPVTPPWLAVMVAVPVPAPVASPVLSMVATEGVTDAQVTW